MIDLAYARQYVRTLLESLDAIDTAARNVAEQRSLASKIAAENEEKTKQVQALEVRRRDLEGQVAKAQADLAEWTKKADEARATASNEENRLKTIRQQLAAVQAQFGSK